MIVFNKAKYLFVSRNIIANIINCGLRAIEILKNIMDRSIFPANKLIEAKYRNGMAQTAVLPRSRAASKGNAKSPRNRT